jgi:hypothetical protein
MKLAGHVWCGRTLVILLPTADNKKPPQRLGQRCRGLMKRVAWDQPERDYPPEGTARLEGWTLNRRLLILRI